MRLVDIQKRVAGPEGGEPDFILLDHGSGGKRSHSLVESITRLLGSSGPEELDDSAVFSVVGGRLAVTTDSFVVDPIFFPGGDIGRLCVCGTVNDLAMSAARPMALTVGFILEEGLPWEDLARIVRSMAETAQEIDVRLAAGDTKVVPRGKADKIFINTSGVGIVEADCTVGGRMARPGDRIVVSGTVGDHGVAILAAREGLFLDTPLESDTRPLWSLTRAVLDTGAGIHTLRDPTRGGVATTLNEIALQSGVGIEIDEEAVPYRDEVLGACEILGLDPLFLANEGKMIVFVEPGHVDRVLAAMRNHPDGKEAREIGEAVAEHPGRVLLRTRIGGKRIVDMLTGQQLPRIC